MDTAVWRGCSVKNMDTACGCAVRKHQAWTLRTTVELCVDLQDATGQSTAARRKKSIGVSQGWLATISRRGASFIVGVILAVVRPEGTSLGRRHAKVLGKGRESLRVRGECSPGRTSKQGFSTTS